MGELLRWVGGVASDRFLKSLESWREALHSTPPLPPSLNHSWLLLARVITFFFAFSEGSELFHSSASGDPGKHRGRQEEEKGGCAWCGVVLCVLGSRLA